MTQLSLIDIIDKMSGTEKPIVEIVNELLEESKKEDFSAAEDKQEIVELMETLLAQFTAFEVTANKDHKTKEFIDSIKLLSERFKNAK